MILLSQINVNISSKNLGGQTYESIKTINDKVSKLLYTKSDVG